MQPKLLHTSSLGGVDDSSFQTLTLPDGTLQLLESLVVMRGGRDPRPVHSVGDGSILNV